MKYAAVLILVLAGWSALKPEPVSWVFVAVVFAIEVWLVGRMRAVARGPVPVGEPPYAFSAEEARFIERYRLAGMVLALWLTFRQAFPQAVLIGANLFLVGWLTKRLAPHFALRVAASRGDREALRMLELLDPLWAKIKATNQSQGPS